MIQARYELLRLKGWENRGKFERGTSGIRSQTGLGRSWNRRDIPRIPETPSHCRQLCPTLTLEELSPVRARSEVAPSHDCNFEIRSSESAYPRYKIVSRKYRFPAYLQRSRRFFTFECLYRSASYMFRAR